VRSSGQILFLIGFALLAAALCTVAVATLGFAAGVTIGPATLPVGVGLGVVLTAWAARARVLPARAAVTAIAAALLAGTFAVWISACVLDVTADGQYYHQQAIVDLHGGWNPWREAPPQSPADIWTQHYPKADWILGASAYALTGQVESGKAFHLVFAAASFVLALAAAGELFRPRWIAMLVALLLALNPVTTVQLFGGYVDGEVSSLLVCLVALAVLERVAPHPDQRLALLFATALVADLKFTGGPYAVMLAGGLPVVLARERRWREAWREVLPLASGLVVAVAFFGFNPYVTNFLEQGHPLYPVAGANAIEFMTGSTPADFQRMNRVAGLVVSLFSRSENLAEPDQSRLKWPFTYTEEELGSFCIPDTRVGGFGPLAGAVAIVTVVLVLALAARAPGLRRPWLWAAAIAAGSAALNPYAWWARYIPQLWMVPIAVVLASWPERARLVVILRLALVAVLVLNAGLVAKMSVEGARDGSANVLRQIESLKRCGRPIVVYFSSATSARTRFRERGLDYREVASIDDLPCADHFRIDGFDGRICEACPP
jgi:hypothetical protein